MLQVQIRVRIVEGIADVCVPQLMEERSEDQKSNPQMQVPTRTAKQTLDPTVQQILGEFVVIQTLLVEPAVKVAKAIPQERVHMMTSRQVPGAQTVHKTFENQQKQSVDMVVYMPVAAEHQVPTVQRAQRTVEVLKVFIDNVVVGFRGRQWAILPHGASPVVHISRTIPRVESIAVMLTLGR